MLTTPTHDTVPVTYNDESDCFIALAIVQSKGRYEEEHAHKDNMMEMSHKPTKNQPDKKHKPSKPALTPEEIAAKKAQSKAAKELIKTKMQDWLYTQYSNDIIVQEICSIDPGKKTVTNSASTIR
jgi:hypothetical protein